MSSHLSRRDFLSSTSKFITAGFAGSLLSSRLFTAPAKKGNGKNVLFIITDDLKPMLNCYGQNQIISPHIDRLASEGMVFERTYCQYPVCGPSRQSFLSGMRPETTGIYGNRLVKDEEMMGKPSMPKHFKNNGYYTMSIGKVYHNPTLQDLDAWSEKPECIATHVYNLQKNKDKMEEIQKKGLAEGKPWEEIRWELLVACTEDADVPDDGYMPGKHCNIALEKLRERAKDKSQPFFMAVGFFRPHYPFNAPKKYWDMYDRDKLKLADNQFRPKNAKYVRLKNWEAIAYGDVPDEEVFDEKLQRRMLNGYYACVTYLDTQIGKLLDELKKLGLQDDTIVVLIGDHGFHLGDHGLWGKFTHFEEAARVPMIFKVPGMKNAGTKTKALTEFIDIYPSLADLAGLDIPEHTEGVSAAALLENPQRPWKKAAFTQYNLGDAWGKSMKVQRYRYTEWTDHKSGRLLARELYDHRFDPQENENIGEYPENKQLINKLAEIMAAGWKNAKPK